MIRILRSLAVGAVVALSAVSILTAVTAPHQHSVASTLRGGPVAAVNGPIAPPVRGYAEGQEIWFLHTEASDQTVAKLLADMVGWPVHFVPTLASAPKTMLARVYIFRNGVEGGGTLKFQPDVFDNPPGRSAYSPLRSVNVVTWKYDRTARILRSAAEVHAASASAQLSIDDLGVVVNMPIVTRSGEGRERS